MKRWQFEVAKFGSYLAIPVVVWTMFSSDWYQKYVLLPDAKKKNPQLYMTLCPEDEEFAAEMKKKEENATRVVEEMRAKHAAILLEADLNRNNNIKKNS